MELPACLYPPSFSETIISLDILNLRTSKYNKNYPITSFDFQKESDAPTGEGTIQLHYSKELYNLITSYSEFVISTGWKYPDNTLDVKDFIMGFIKDMDTDDKVINLSIVDFGILLEQSAVVSYTKKKRSFICSDLIKKAGMIPVIDFTGVKDDVLDFSSESTEVSGSDVSGNFKSSCARCSSEFKNGKWYHTTAKNYCPLCKVSGKIVAVYPSTAPEGEYHCDACDGDFCGLDGYEKMPSPRGRVTITSGPDEVASKSQSTNKVDNSGTATTASTTDNSKSSTDTTATSSDGMTYWDMLVKLLDPVAHDLQVFVWLNRVYINRVPDPESAKLLIDETKNLIDISIQEGDPFITNTIIINYGNKAHPTQYTLVDKRLKEKVGKSNTLKINCYGLSENEVRVKARQELAKAQRQSEFTIDANIIGHPEWYIDRWAKVLVPKHNIEDKYYITSLNISCDESNSLKNGVTLKEYYPDLSENNTNESSFNLNTLSGIMKSAEGYGYCSSPTFIKSKGKSCGDCWAMSDYLYNKLTMAGMSARILQYRTGSSSRHRSVQVKQGNNWVDLPYRDYKIHENFRATKNKPGMFVFKGG